MANYEIPLDDTPPAEFIEAAKALVDGRGVEKLWDRFIEDLTEQLVYEGPLRAELDDDDLLEVAADWVIQATLRRFGFEFKGIPTEYRAICGHQVLTSDFDFAMATPGQDGKCKRLLGHPANHDVREMMRGL